MAAPLSRVFTSLGGQSFSANGDLEKKVEEKLSLEKSFWRNLLSWVWKKHEKATEYEYDVFGNLQKVTLPGGKIIEYVVDGQNRRVGKKVNGTLVQGFLYQSQTQVAAELDGSGRVVKRFIYGSKSNSPDYMVMSGKEYRILSNHVGTPGAGGRGRPVRRTACGGGLFASAGGWLCGAAPVESAEIGGLPGEAGISSVSVRPDAVRKTIHIVRGAGNAVAQR